MKQKKTIKRIIKVTAVVFLLTVLGVTGWVFREMRDLAHTIFPGSMTVFNYDMEPVNVTIGNTQFAIPKAYIRSKLIYGVDGTLSEFNIWASLKDDMAPWTKSESFQRRDKTAGVMIDIGRAFNPYDKIHNEKKRGGLVNRGTYKKIFTRYTPAPYKERIPFDKAKGLQWYRDNYEEIHARNDREYTRFYLDGEDMVVMEYYMHFFLIPKGYEKYFIDCPNDIQAKYWNCRVDVWDNPTRYQFLIPFPIVDQFLEYDAKVSALIERLIVHPQPEEKKP